MSTQISIVSSQAGSQAATPTSDRKEDGKKREAVVSALVQESIQIQKNPLGPGRSPAENT